jgi:hypothetical protein
MIGVASQIIFCIFAAAVIGSVAGYLIRGLRSDARVAEVEKLWKSKLDQRDGELAALREGGASVAPIAIVGEPSSPHAGGSIETPTSARLAVKTPENNAGQFEDKLSEALSLIEKLARSQERMENEIAALRKGDSNELKLEPSAPKP